MNRCDKQPLEHVVEMNGCRREYFGAHGRDGVLIKECIFYVGGGKVCSSRIDYCCNVNMYLRLYTVDWFDICVCIFWNLERILALSKEDIVLLYIVYGNGWN